MKKALAFALAIMTLFCFSVTYGEGAEAREVGDTATPCMVNANRVNERVGPGKRFKSVGQHDKGEVLDVIDMSGTWWQLANGNYMHSKYLTKMCENDGDPDVEFIVEEDGTDADIQDIEVPVAPIQTEKDPEQEEAGLARRMNFACALSGTDKEEVVSKTHNCVLLITREQCIECYQNYQLVLKIQLVLSVPYAKFAVTEQKGAMYEVRYIRDVMNLVLSHSTDDSYFVVID